MLNALCNDNLYAIFESLSTFRELLEVANVCVRFMPIVQNVVGRRYAKEYVTLPSHDHQAYMRMHEAEPYFRIFGEHIKWLKHVRCEGIYVLVAKCCENLTALDLGQGLLEQQEWIELQPLIPQLRSLSFKYDNRWYDSMKFGDERLFDVIFRSNRLESLRVGCAGEGCKFLVNMHFPQLTVLTVAYFCIGKKREAENFANFLCRNRSIQELIFHYSWVSKKIFKNVTRCLPQIRTMRFHSTHLVMSQPYAIKPTQSYLKRIKEFEIRGMTALKCFQALLDHGIPSERLILTHFLLFYDEIIPMIAKMVDLKHLELNMVLQDGAANLIAIVKNMKQLETIRVRSTSIKLTDIIEMKSAICCPHLEEIHFEIENKDIDFSNDITMANCDNIVKAWGNTIRVILRTELRVSIFRNHEGIIYWMVEFVF